MSKLPQVSGADGVGALQKIGFTVRRRASIDLPVIGNNGLRKRIVATHDDMAALLPRDIEACSLQCRNTFSSRKTR